MYKVGLASVSFRNLRAKDIVSHAKSSGIDGIEWGGDVHVPCSSTDTAKSVRELTNQNGLAVFSYGSYFRLGVHDISELEAWLDTAAALGAPIIRIWAGDKNGALCTDAELDAFIRDAHIASQLAQQYNITLALECHDSTYTDDYEFEIKILDAVNSKYFKTLWQPNRFKAFEYNLRSVKALIPYTVQFHTQRWDGDKRFFLREFFDEWKAYFDVIAKQKRGFNFILEFMPDNRTESIKTEADTVRKFINNVE